ncbi:MAG TPA: PhoU domain-containing protein [Acidimicrobiales bacterium]|nr:PhoU domain-containing protein [Acidimicrobiales bacterium]
MGPDRRGEFHRDLERLDIAVGGFFGLIPDAIEAATAALLYSDAEIAARVQRWRRLVEELYGDVERTIEVVVARQAPVAGDLRFLLACVRLVPNLQETVDLVADVASPSHLELAVHLPARAVAVTHQLGAEAASVWSRLGQLWAERSPAVLADVRSGVDELADRRSTLSAELASGSVSLPVALELAVVGRNFDRIGRQAENAAALVAPLVPQAG